MFKPLLRTFTLFQGHGGVGIIHWWFQPWPIFLISTVVLTESKNCSLACSPCTSITVHVTRILGEPHWLPANDRISRSCMPVFNAVTYSAPSCLSDLLQLCSPSRSLHFSVGTRLRPLPSCRGKTGGDCTFSRLGLLYGTHCHFTSGVQQPSKRSSWVPVVYFRLRIIWLAWFLIGFLPSSSSSSACCCFCCCTCYLFSSSSFLLVVTVHVIAVNCQLLI